MLEKALSQKELSALYGCRYLKFIRNFVGRLKPI